VNGSDWNERRTAGDCGRKGTMGGDWRGVSEVQEPGTEYEGVKREERLLSYTNRL